MWCLETLHKLNEKECAKRARRNAAALNQRQKAQARKIQHLEAALREKQKTIEELKRVLEVEE